MGGQARCENGERAGEGWEGRTAHALLNGGCPDVIRERQRYEVEACGLVPPVFVHLLGL